MKLLLDTHILLWALTDHPALSRPAKSLIEDPQNETFASVINIWEMAIKHALRRGGPNDMPLSGEAALIEVRRSTHALIAIEAEHVVHVDRLPPLHGDPFDRLLVAQARVESTHLLTHEKKLAEHGDHVIVV